MNEDSKIKNVLQKFILNQCTQEEMQEVIAYYKENKLTDAFPTVEDIQLLIDNDQKMDSETAEILFATILTEIEEKQTIAINSRKYNYAKYISIAASFLILLAIGWSYKQDFFNRNLNTQEITNSNEITLQLGNGEIQIIAQNKKSQVTDSKGNVIGTQNGNKIIYDTKTSLENLVYNIIKIPYGKRFELELSDGTIVHLNSGSTLKYPVKFIANSNRQVFLDGEAYFDVTKDKKHPFVVNADNLNIRVLGTHFNVSSYPEDKFTDVVLVEGSVGLYEKNEKFDAAKNTMLKPGFKGSFNKKDNHIDIEQVVTDSYTSWMQGKLVFKNMTFRDIEKKLERHYNVSIVNQNKKLADEKFYATFKDEPIEKILSYFNDIQGCNYTIKNNEVLIK